MEYAALGVLLVAPLVAAIAAYGTGLGRLVLFAPLVAIAVGFWIAYGLLNVGGIGLTRGLAAFVIGLYTVAWLLLCHLLVSSAQALQLRRHREY